MTINQQGICSNCAHTTECALTPAKRTSRGIQFCEEYETVPVAAVGPANRRSSGKAVPQHRPGILGLCSNCANYPGCSFPKPESGVWHCEDYL